MRYLLISILFVLAFCSCQKEDELTNELDFSNVFEITNNPNDAVQSARYEIYSKYNVSVYFNDTVASQLIRYDINGNPYYRYETLDMAWTFFDESGTDENVTYRYFYTKGEEQQLKALERITALLDGLNEKMRPAIIFAVDSVFLLRSDGVISDVLGYAETSKDIWGNITVTRNVHYRSNFRNLLITSLPDISDEMAAELNVSLTRDLAVSKIHNFADQLSAFERITPDDYNRTGVFEYPTDDDMIAEVGAGLETLMAYYGAYYVGYGRPDAMFETGYEERVMGYGFPESFIEASRVRYASIVGPLGFVMPRSTTSGEAMRNTPVDVDADITAFVQLALMYTPEEINHYWGGYPLVMQKYNIIKDILVNEMGIDLETE